MKIVAVSQRVEAYPERDEIRDTLDQELVMFIASGGGLAVPVPNVLLAAGNLSLWLMSLQPSAIVLSGGNNIGEHQERDFTEHALLDYAKENNLPVLAICRGMQLMGIWGGAELKIVSGHIATQHQIIGEITDVVNSYHNYALTNCPDDFIVLAQSEDGEIEAIKHKILQWEGWMWHPERGYNFNANDICRLKALLGA